MRLHRCAVGALVAGAIAGCGGGAGSADATAAAATTPGATVVSAGAQAPLGPTASGDAVAAVATPAVAIVAPGTPAIDPTRTVSGQAVARALSTPQRRLLGTEAKSDALTRLVATPGVAAPGAFVASAWSADLLAFDGTPLAGAAWRLEATGSAGTLAFTGRGELRTAVRGEPAPTAGALAGAPWSVPAAVPLDERLAEWTGPGAREALELVVGAVPGRPERMRVCWRLRTALLRQSACSHHLRSDGSPVGADVVHDVGGAAPTVRTHAADDGSTSSPRVLECERVQSDRGVEVSRTIEFVAVRLDYPILELDWENRIDLSRHEPPLYTASSEPLPDGTTRHRATNPRTVVEVDARGAAVVRHRQAGGFAGLSSTLACAP
ncbi:MAG TPA: hypothetical protein VEA81_18195 [Burkholderiaceae bacterium]|nr:hypothetical protein [Burkholderiaceae bacterium]